jgi:hypothetical protein
VILGGTMPALQTNLFDRLDAAGYLPVEPSTEI